MGTPAVLMMTSASTPAGLFSPTFGLRTSMMLNSSIGSAIRAQPRKMTLSSSSLHQSMDCQTSQLQTVMGIYHICRISHPMISDICTGGISHIEWKYAQEGKLSPNSYLAAPTLPSTSAMSSLISYVASSPEQVEVAQQIVVSSQELQVELGQRQARLPCVPQCHVRSFDYSSTIKHRILLIQTCFDIC